MGPRRFKRQVIVATLLLVTVICLMHSFEYEDAKVATNTPLLLKYIYRPSGKGGGKIQTLIFPGLTPLTKAVWHIPSSWLENATTKPENIGEAAKLASGKAQAPQRQIPFSNIPMEEHGSADMAPVNPSEHGEMAPSGRGGRDGLLPLGRRGD
jgi:hypothetical protein